MDNLEILTTKDTQHNMSWTPLCAKKPQITEVRQVQLLDEMGVHREPIVRPSVIGQIISLHVP